MSMDLMEGRLMGWACSSVSLQDNQPQRWSMVQPASSPQPDCRPTVLCSTWSLNCCPGAVCPAKQDL